MENREKPGKKPKAPEHNNPRPFNQSLADAVSRLGADAQREKAFGDLAGYMRAYFLKCTEAGFSRDEALYMASALQAHILNSGRAGNGGDSQ